MRKLILISFLIILSSIYFSCGRGGYYSLSPAPRTQYSISEPLSKSGTVSLIVTNSREGKETKTYSCTDYTFSTNKIYIEFKENNSEWGFYTEGLRITVYGKTNGVYTNSQVKVYRAYRQPGYGGYWYEHEDVNPMTVTITDFVSNRLVKGSINGYLYGYFDEYYSGDETYKIDGSFTAKLNYELIEVEF